MIFPEPIGDMFFCDENGELGFKALNVRFRDMIP